MRYLRWTSEDGDLGEGLVEEWTEVGDDGVVLREIGFDSNGNIAHKMPSAKFKHGKYGHFDLAPISLAMVWHRRNDANPDQIWLRQQVTETARSLG